MSQRLTYNPDYVSPPGDTLLDALEERGMTQAELAERTGLSRKTVNEIIKGKAPITPETALSLERVLAVPARFWNEREALYQEALALEEEAARLRSQADWVRRFPYPEMAGLGMVRDIDGRSRYAVEERGRELLTYFGVSSAEQWEHVWLESSAAFRQSLRFASDPEAVSAWLRYGEIVASESREIEPYDGDRFKGALYEVRQLTMQSSRDFCAGIIRECARAGVAVVFTPQLPKARISGATQWLRSDLALIQLSLRYKTDDHFWFTFFHEAAHILLHGKRDVFLEGAEDRGEERKEQEANNWAARFLIPAAQLAAFLGKKKRSREAVLQFSRELSIAPGIVVGQLQHIGFLPRHHLNGLKRRLRWVEA